MSHFFLNSAQGIMEIFKAMFPDSNIAQERSPLQFHFARKLQSLDPRVMVSEPESVDKMFQQVLKTLVEEELKTNQQADSELDQFRKLISEAKKYHYERFATYCFTQERLDKFFSKLLENKEEYEQLWMTMKMLLTLSHGQAAVERGFSVNKEILNPNLQEMSLRAIRLIYSSLSTEKIKLAEFHISEELLFSCNYAPNRYKMHMIEKKIEKEDKVKGKKRRALEEELGSVKKKRELESIAQRLIDTADKKAKEAEKTENASQMKALLMESNTSREKLQKLQKRDIPAQKKEIQDPQKQLKELY